MIPRAHITAWRARAPWALDEQVEQDLVISRAVVEIYQDPLLAKELAIRGGTALHKLYFGSARRYSEDIDLVQIAPKPIGPVMSAIRARLDPWLDTPKRKQSRGRVTFIYRFQSEFQPASEKRLKLEINTREHFTELGLCGRRFAVDNPWFAGHADVVTFEPEELLGTKLRALYQRKKGRDLFDLGIALEHLLQPDPVKIVRCFERYLAEEGLRVSPAEFASNLARKLEDRAFLDDLTPLLPVQSGDAERYDAERAAEEVRRILLSQLR